MLAAEDDTEDNCWLTCMLFEPEILGGLTPIGSTVDGVIAEFDRRGIEARNLWKPLHSQPAFSHEQAALNGTSARLFRSGVALPSGSTLSHRDIDRIIEALYEVLEPALETAS